MVIETTKEQIVLNQIIGVKKETRTVETDIIVNDVKPDVLNVISTSGVVNIYKKEVMDGKVRIDGGINTYVIYLADDEKGNTRSLNNSLDFTQMIDIDNCREGMLLDENINIINFETKIINGRKINVKANIEIETKVYSNSNIEVITGINETSNIQMLNKEQQITTLLGMGTNRIYAKDTVAINMTDNISEIMRVETNIIQEETKISYNKVLSKANAEIEIMYITEDNRINTVNAKIPVMGVVDIQNINDSCSCNVKNTLQNLVIKPNSAEQHSIYIEAEVELSCIAYETKNINIIEDLYSLMADVETTNDKIQIITQRHSVQDEYMIKENIRVPDLTGNIYNVSATPVITKYEVMTNKVAYVGETRVEILFNQNNSMNSRTLQIPFTYEIDSDNITENGIVQTQIVPRQSDAVVKDGMIEIALKVGFNLQVETSEKIEIIRDINVQENNSTDNYSMTIYFVKPTDTLWKIAKKFKSTVEDIAKINEIEDVNKINIGEQLYIPKGVRTAI